MNAAYDAVAEWYDQSVRQGTLLSGDALIASAAFETIGSVSGQRVCDLACGQGDIARQLARRGASVVGIDVSRKLLAIAADEEVREPLGITYHQCDAQAVKQVLEPFDGVLCNMALMDIPDLAATFRTDYGLLRPGGWFVLTITHPCFQVPPGRSYYEEGFWRSDNPSGVRGQVGAHHRTLTTYLNALNDAGLTLERSAEPRLPGREAPVVLVAQCRKTKGSAAS